MIDGSDQTSVGFNECWAGLPEEVTERVVIATGNFAIGLWSDLALFIFSRWT